MDPSGRGIGWEDQVRKSQVLHDLPALAARRELLAMLGDVDAEDPHGGADHGGGERDRPGEPLVEGRHLFGEVVAVHGDHLEEAIHLVTACHRRPRGGRGSARARRP